MFERYCYEPGLNNDYYIFDRQLGYGSERTDRNGNKLGIVYDVEIAQRIVRLLNADVARVERQGARVA